MSKKNSNPFAHAWVGISATFHTERNFKIHVACSLLVIILGIWLPLTTSDWYWIALCIALVLVTELLNTAVESIVDLVSPTYHPLAKKAKDAAAGAVLIAAIFSLIIGGMIFIPKLCSYFGG
ncbi:diacylglycerol kinase family protein [Parapedobacter koreensis]|uniref:Undecaprenol kinase/diacylglycerol kinase (ATP) n=1 Tax=Parapedobacter koreensis TaxID=332977 RepID=A0A1H7Q3J3_9SPHI|nr:diacylglycerol kinase family protein [Parapedobacter koreensis]SEL42711.1 undecaprenol kinase/diacylglycerol kinase (ATP) [Parapedobacter koreensis]